jgi:hypothetical protein
MEIYWFSTVICWLHVDGVWSGSFWLEICWVENFLHFLEPEIRILMRNLDNLNKQKLPSVSKNVEYFPGPLVLGKLRFLPLVLARLLVRVWVVDETTRNSEFGIWRCTLCFFSRFCGLWRIPFFIVLLIVRFKLNLLLILIYFNWDLFFEFNSGKNKQAFCGQPFWILLWKTEGTNSLADRWLVDSLGGNIDKFPLFWIPFKVDEFHGIINNTK